MKRKTWTPSKSIKCLYKGRRKEATTKLNPIAQFIWRLDVEHLNAEEPMLSHLDLRNLLSALGQYFFSVTLDIGTVVISIRTEEKGPDE